jgi:hypothetical protein
MKITMLLADSAQAVGGKLFILGGGWSISGPGPFPSALAALIQVPWTETNVKHPFTLSIVDSDENPLLVPTPFGEQAFQIQSEFEVGRPAGVKPGTPIDVPIAINLGPLPFKPDTMYMWRLVIDNDTSKSADCAFYIRPLPAAPAGPPQVGM